MTDEIPERLQRNAQNVAPFMELTPWQQKRRDQNSDEWEPDLPPVKVREEVWFSGVDPRAKFAVNPSGSPQAKVQDWLPPWVSKS